MIHFPDVREGDETFEGYMGHDTFTIEGRKLVRMFPVYNERATPTRTRPAGGASWFTVWFPGRPGGS
jgi:hypothetical protein